MKRIVFGQEKHMIQLLPTCAECGAYIGDQHAPGCHLEECPRCGRAMVYCRCQSVLEPNEEFRLHVELAAKFESWRESTRHLSRQEDNNQMNMVESAAALRGVIDRPNTITGDINPIGWSAGGEPVFSDGDLKNGLGLTDEGVEMVRTVMLERQTSPSNFWC